MNKPIHRDTGSSTKIFDNRTLEKDYATLVTVLRKGLRVLDVGCGTGAISKDIARQVGNSGYVVGIDNTRDFINSGEKTYKDVLNLKLIHADLFDFRPDDKFDLVVTARVLQWLSNPKEALKKIASFLKPGGMLSALDYNHEALEWKPQPPESMQIFYKAFLKWRSDSGMDNRIADNLEGHFRDAGFHSVKVLDAEEVYKRGIDNFIQRIGIWSKVAELKQIVEEGYLTEAMRIRAIEDYNRWILTDAEMMTMKLKEVRGQVD